MKYFLGIFTFILIFSLGDFVLAADTAAKPYIPMVGVPGLENANNYTAEMYIDAIYKLAITVGGILAVIQIIYGGVTYMFDGTITHKEAGKDRIKGALFGLLIILSAVLILQTINPDLLNLKIFNNAPSISGIEESRIAEAALAPAQPGSRVSGGNPDAVKHLKQTCGGPVGTESTMVGRGGITEYVCYANVSDTKAGIETSFDESLYLESQREDALKAYQASCTASGGENYTSFFGTVRCTQKTTPTDPSESLGSPM
jgi:hypothetical protein